MNSLVGRFSNLLFGLIIFLNRLFHLLRILNTSCSIIKSIDTSIDTIINTGCLCKTFIALQILRSI